MHNRYVESIVYYCIFFFNDTATTEIYTLSLHDALPICARRPGSLEILPGRPSQPFRLFYGSGAGKVFDVSTAFGNVSDRDRKSTRLNSSHANISYAVFCLKKKKKKYNLQNALMYNIMLL